jgi:hypothetical protein
MTTLAMELRRVDQSERVVVGVVAPYDEVSYLTPDPAGEVIDRGAFKRSLHHRHDRIPLLRNHDTDRTLGWSTKFTETDTGLEAMFKINDGDHGDALLDDMERRYLTGMSVGYKPIRVRRGEGGVQHVIEARLVEVSMVGIPAYEGAAMIAVRNAQDLTSILAPFAARPDVNLAPIMPTWRG